MSVTKQGSNYFQYGAILSASSIAFYCGSTYSWSSPVIPLLRSNDTDLNPIQKPITVLEETWLASIFMIGNFISASISGLFSQRFGRKKTLIGFSLCLVTSFVICIFSTQIMHFLIARLLMGLGAGCILSTLPSYIAEIAEESIRGISGGLFGIMFSIGHLLNYGVGPFVSMTTLNILQLLPLAMLYITFVPFVPESPYYFISADDIAGAKTSLKKFRGTCMIEEELKLVTRTIEEAQDNKLGMADLFKSKVTVKGLIIACGVLAIQQLSGVCAVQAYLQPIFDESGGFVPSEFSVLIVGLVQLLGNMVATSLVDRSGRRMLLLLSSSGSAVSLILLGLYFYLQVNGYTVTALAWLPVTSLMVFIFSINIGLASIPWVISAEIFSPSIKSISTSLATSFNIICAFLATGTYPYLSVTLGIAGTFWVYSAFLILGVIFVALVVPETKGKTFSEIQKLLLGDQALTQEEFEIKA